MTEARTSEMAPEWPTLSLIIPAYNEERRLPTTMEAVLSYLTAQPYTWEVLIADDGSEDATPAIAAIWQQREARVRHLRLPHRGKAAAVFSGVMAAHGQFIVFTDADLSTPIHYLEPMMALLNQGWDIVIGSREGETAKRLGEPWHRHLMGRVFNWVVQLLAVPGIPDTQCGFKGFHAAVARTLFAACQLYRNDTLLVRGPRVTGFDVELLYVARRAGYRIAILPVTWRHVPGSKVDPVSDSMRMLGDVLRVRWYAWRGRYDVSLPSSLASLPGQHQDKATIPEVRK